MGPVWPDDDSLLPKLITFHGAAAFSMPAVDFWGNLDAAFENEQIVEQRLQHWLTEAAGVAAAIVPSAFARWELSKFIGIDVGRIHVAGHGVDFGVFKPIGRVEEQTGLIHVSAWQPKKNLFRITDAYSMLPEDTRPPLTLIVPQVSPSKLPTIPGMRIITESQNSSSLAAFYRGASALVFPSLHETFGMPVMEAMACGCPVITASGSALEEIYANAALLIDAKNISEISDAMVRVTTDQLLWNDLRSKGLDLAARFGWQTSAAAHKEIFINVLAREAGDGEGHGASNTAIFVLGMHRSGTSALAGTLSKLGVDFGPDLLPPQPDNPKGFFEHKEIVTIHDEILCKIGLRWDDPRPLPPHWEQRRDLESLKERLKEVVIRDFGESLLWGLKDPRLCRLLPLWIPMLKELNVTLYVVMLLRDPAEVAGSLSSRNNLDPAQSQLLWLRYNLEAEYNSRGLVRAFMRYDDLLHDWKEAIGGVSDTFALQWPFPIHTIAADVCTFLDRSLKHQESFEIRHHRESDIGSLTRLSDLLYGVGDAGPQARYDEISDELGRMDQNAGAYLSALQQVHSELDPVHGELGKTREELIRTHHDLKQARSELVRTDADLGKAREELILTHHALGESRTENELREQIIRQHQEEIAAMLRSRSWRVTAPLRHAGIIARQMRLHKVRSLLARNASGAEQRLRFARTAYYSIPLPIAIKRRLRNPVRRFLSAPVLDQYEEWIRRFDTLTDEDREGIAQHIAGFSRKPVLSILLPTFNTAPEFLRAAIESVRHQIYPYWELCIADDASTSADVRPVLEHYAVLDDRIRILFRATNGHISEATNSALDLATGDFVVLLDHDDELAETALYFVALEINRYPKVKLIYSDEDKINGQGKRLDPYFKPDFSYDLFLGQNMISHLGVYDTALMRDVGGFRKGFEGAQDWDLALRFVEHIEPSEIRHIPRILYHWRVIPGSTAMDSDQKPYAYMAQRKALEDHMRRQGIAVQFEDHPRLPTAFHRARWPLLETLPLVSILIPTHNAQELLAQCISSIQEQTTYRPYEIIVIDNRSNDAKTLEYLDRISQQLGIQVLRYPQPFNYAAINNFAAAHALGEILVLLNNDTEVIGPDWLTELVSHALRPEVGAVGAKLFYPDGSVQHGGVILGLGGFAAHSHRGFPGNHPGQSGRLWLAQNYSAVTGACLVVRRELYLAAGGLDEKNFPIAYNDVDFCLRLLERGYVNVFTPYAELYHYESKTRGSDTHGEGRLRFTREKRALQQRHKSVIENDPFYNPNLTLATEDFSLGYPSRVNKPWVQDVGAQVAHGNGEDETGAVPAKLFWHDYPIAENAIALYEGLWTSMTPHSALADTAGNLELVKEDPRARWAIQSFGGLADCRILELGPLEGRQSYSLYRAGAKEIVAIEGNAAAFQRLLAFKNALKLDNLRPLLGDFVPYLEQTQEQFDLVFASGVLYHLEDPLTAIEQMARVAPKLFLWTHIYDAQRVAQHPGWRDRFALPQQWKWHGLAMDGARQRYTDRLRREFCGGISEGSLWLTRQSLFSALGSLGYRIIQTQEEAEHPNGPAIWISAIRDL
jgi:glycosyltransferase involved in cell wall biosynthesis